MWQGLVGLGWIRLIGLWESEQNPLVGVFKLVHGSSSLNVSGTKSSIGSGSLVGYYRFFSGFQMGSVVGLVLSVGFIAGMSWFATSESIIVETTGQHGMLTSTAGIN